MRREAEAVGMKDVYIDAKCMEMDVKEYKETITHNAYQKKNNNTFWL